MVDTALIIPTLQRPELYQLLDDLDSACLFGRDDLEVIVVASRDAPSDKLVRLARSRGFTVCHEPNSGQAAALNRGARCSSSRVLAFIDDDVRIVDPSWLDRLTDHLSDPLVGYCSGDVQPVGTSSFASEAWQVLGGLSKGPRPRHYSWDSMWAERQPGVPIHRVAVGANAVMPRSVYESVNGHCELFGVGSPIGHGQSLEIVYGVLRKGYFAIYDPTSIVGHSDPTSFLDIVRKLFVYGIGDTAVQIHFFVRYGDGAGLLEAFGGRQLRFAKRVIANPGKLFTPAGVLTVAREAGALLGPLIYLRAIWRYRATITARQP